MKFTVIGFGQCGNRIADEFARINTKARRERGIEIAPAVFAINTDTADLSGLTHIPDNFRHRILIGGRKTGGHGVGKVNEIAAEIAKQDSARIFDAVRSTPRAFESDAFLLVASGAGGTGSGSISVTTQILRERYRDKPLYALVVLPFEHEELTEERTIYNTALCLKSINSVADAVLLVDNQRFVGIGSSLSNNYADINRLIVEPFYDLLCAGEETNSRRVGTKTLDAGDVIQTLEGWTVLGYGKSQLSVFNLPFKQSSFRTKGTQTQKGVQALDKALSDLSVECNVSDATKALYLVSGPGNELNTELVREVGEYLRGLLPQATIRNGDYPRERVNLGVHLMLSGFTSVDKVKQYYARSIIFIQEMKRRREQREISLQEMEDFGKELPRLL
ncbi:MAG: cell division protein FtsZ [Chloroflexi bacterium]|nr:cell division protein FtsZ [Chloroflexota bacterium]